MPIIFIGIILVVLCICFATIYIIKKEVRLEKGGLNIVIFVLSLFSLVISLRLFWNKAIYADEYNASPVLMSGGTFWLYMDWMRLALLFVICVISGLKLLKSSK